MKKDKDGPGGPAPTADPLVEKEGLGALLRKQREAQGLNYAAIAEKTRLRPSILEAMEEEAWDRLPPPVFVRGFLRSYARALGLGEEEVLGRFRALQPKEESPLTHPLLGPPTERRAWPRILLVLLALAGLGILVWASLPSGTEEKAPPQSKAPAAATTGVSEMGSTGPASPAKTGNAGAAAPENAPTVAPAMVAEAPPVPKVPEAPEAVEEKPAVGETERTTPAASEAGKSLAPEPGEGREPPPQAEPLNLAGAGAGTVTPPAATGMTLRMKILERSWVRVVVDGADAKEYIFRPGSTPSWKGESSFEVSIGNAGGVTVELNGEEFKDLGPAGKVVHLQLPRDLKRLRNGG